MLRGPLDARRADLEPDRQLLEGQVAELLDQRLLQRLRRPEVGAGAHGPADGAQRAVAVHLAPAAGGALPERGELLDDAEVGLAGDQGAVEGADAGAEHQVRDDAALEQRAQHADLDGAEHAAAAEHECGRHTRASVPPAPGARHGPAPSHRCSAQKLRTGIVPQTSVTSVKPMGHRALRESRNALTRKIM